MSSVSDQHSFNTDLDPVLNQHAADLDPGFFLTLSEILNACCFLK